MKVNIIEMSVVSCPPCLEALEVKTAAVFPTNCPFNQIWAVRSQKLRN